MPYSWMLRGVSSGANSIMCNVFGLRSTSARVVIISLTYSPAPYWRHNRRNATLVMPAIGASTTGGSATTVGDNRSGAAPTVAGKAGSASGW